MVSSYVIRGKLFQTIIKLVYHLTTRWYLAGCSGVGMCFDYSRGEANGMSKGRKYQRQGDYCDKVMRRWGDHRSKNCNDSSKPHYQHRLLLIDKKKTNITLNGNTKRLFLITQQTKITLQITEIGNILQKKILITHNINFLVNEFFWMYLSEKMHHIA